MKELTITVELEIKVNRDIRDDRRAALILNSLSLVSCRLSKVFESGGLESGVLHHEDGAPYGVFLVSEKLTTR